MAVVLLDNTTFVVFHYRSSDQLSTASFEWPIAQPVDDYTITVGGVRITLDAHIPVRPTRVEVGQAIQEDSPAIEALQRLFGVAFTDAMIQIRTTHSLRARFALSRINREAIAKAQLADMHSPHIIRKGCETMFQGTTIDSEGSTMSIESICIGDVAKPPMS